MNFLRTFSLLAACALVFPAAHAIEFGDVATISQTVDNRVCVYNINGDTDEGIDCGTDAPYVKADGSVGIGTDDPQAKLDVAGTVSATVFNGYAFSSSGSGNKSVTIGSPGEGPSYNSLNLWNAYNTSQPAWTLKGDSKYASILQYGRNHMTIAENTDGTFIPRLRIHNGNVGISVTYPNAKLEVAGTISATGANINGDLTVSGNIVTSQDLTVAGTTFSQGGISTTDISATNIYGDGSNITNLNTSAITMGIDDLTDATANYTTSYTIAIGEGALNEADLGLYNTAVGYQVGYGGTASTTASDRFTGLGYQAGYQNTGNRVTAAGYYAAHGNTGNYVTAAGANAAHGNTGNYVTAAGQEAALRNTGSNVTTAGYQAAYDNTGSNVTAIGAGAAKGNTGSYVTADGSSAAYQNSGTKVTTAGYNAAYQNSGNYLTAAGYAAAKGNSGSNVTAAGSLAAYQNSGTTVTTMGYASARNNEGDYLSALGYEAGHTNTGDNVVAIGYQAGKGNTTANQFIVQQANVNATPLIQGDFSTGHVGIGTDNPQAELDVAGTVSATVFKGYAFSSSGSGNKILTIGSPGDGFTYNGLQIWNSSNANQPAWTLGAFDGSRLYYGSTSMEILENTDGTPISRLRILNDNVGIGTRAPQTALDVMGTVSATGANINGDLTVSGNIVTSQDLTVAGTTFSQGGISTTDISATNFYGDGSNITNLNTSAITMGIDDLTDASANYTTSYTIAIGEGALNELNAGRYNTAVGYRAGYGGTASTTASDRFTGLGYHAAYQNSGDNVTAAGFYVAYQNSGNNVTAAGYSAAFGNSGSNVTAAGMHAAHENSGNYVTAAGANAAYKNTGANVTAAGYNAANENTGANVTAAGYAAAKSNTGDNVTAMGHQSAYQNSGGAVTSMGINSARENTASNVSAIGYASAYQNSGEAISSMGHYSAYQNTGNNLSALGYEAGHTNTGDNVVAIGYQAGKGNTTANQFIVQQANVNATPLIQGDFSTGHVGIGTTSPSQLLEISGSNILHSNLAVSGYTSGVSGLQLEGKDSGGATAYRGIRINTPYQSGTAFNSYLRNTVGSGFSYIGTELGTTTSHPIRFLTNSTGENVNERMRITDTGRVGIGTDDPSTTLHVYDSGDGILSVTSGNAGSAVLDLGKANDLDGGRIVYDSGNNLLFSTASNEQLRIESSGDIGIGTTDPSTKLEVAGTISATAFTGNGSGLTNISADSAASIISGSTYISASEDTSLTFFTAGTQRAIIDERGYMGIGLTPSFQLDVGSTARVAGNLHVAGGLSDYSGNLGLTAAAADGEIILSSNNTEAVRIDKDGNVGIGTDTPSTTLHVMGKGIFHNAATGREIAIDPANGHIDSTNTQLQLNRFADHAVTVGANSNADFYANNGVSIGKITAPSEALDVSGSAIISGELEVAGTVSATSFTGDGSQLTNISADNAASIISGSTYISASENTSLTFFTAGTQRAVIDENGYVGIGTDSPSEKLEISGNARVSGSVHSTSSFTGSQTVSGEERTLFKAQNLGSGNDTEATIAFQSRDIGGNVITNKISSVVSDETSGSGDYDIRFQTIGNGSIGESMRIKGDGQVGIGTESPSSTLHIYADGNASQKLAGTNVAFLQFEGGAGNGQGHVGTYDDGTFRIGAELNAETKHMVIEQDGDIGIGTESPATLLDVSKTLYVTDDGKVGIGTDDPSTTLHIYNNTDHKPVTVHDGAYSYGIGYGFHNDTTNKINLFAVSGAPYIGFNGGGLSFTKSGNASDKLLFLSSLGHTSIVNSAAVGYGDDWAHAPSTALEVSGTVSATSFVGDGSQLTNISADSAASIISGSTYISASENTSLTFFTAGTQRAVIDENGYVGIGTDSPRAALEVQGAFMVSSGATGVHIQDFTGYKRIQTYDAAPLSLNPLGNNVGIGTTSPSATLHVSGSIQVAGTGSETCNDTPHRGQIRVNPTSGKLEICR